MEGTYNPWLVALSVIVAMTASYTALDLAARAASRRKGPSWAWLTIGALVFGAGIWSMHFVGMLAFRLPIPFSFDPELTVLSMAIAVMASGAALFAMSQEAGLTHQRLAVSATFIGVGIAAMHYTGMAAMGMSPPIVYAPLPFVASVLIAIGSSLAALSLPVYLQAYHPRWRVPTRLLSAAVMGIAISGMHYTGMASAMFAADSICTTAGIGQGWDRGELAIVIGATTVAVLMTTLVLSALESQANDYLTGAYQRLQRLAMFDPLTGLPNRMLLQDRFEQSTTAALRVRARVAMLFIDLDRFKGINDRYGHRAGDRVLQEAALRMKAVVRADDTVSRLGGDEFVVLLVSLSVDVDPVAIARKVVSELERPFDFEGQTLRISASIGISLFPDHGRDFATLLQTADAAMYEVKRDGRNGVRLSQVPGPTIPPARMRSGIDARGSVAAPSTSGIGSS